MIPKERVESNAQAPGTAGTAPAGLPPASVTPIQASPSYYDFATHTLGLVYLPFAVESLRPKHAA